MLLSLLLMSARLAATQSDLSNIQCLELQLFSPDVDELLLRELGEGCRLARGLCVQPGNARDNSKEADLAHALLWNRAVSHFKQKQYEQANALFKASTAYGSPQMAAKAWETMALCNMAQKQFERQVPYCHAACHLCWDVYCCG